MRACFDYDAKHEIGIPVYLNKFKFKCVGSTEKTAPTFHRFDWIVRSHVKNKLIIDVAMIISVNFQFQVVYKKPDAIQELTVNSLSSELMHVLKCRLSRGLNVLEE